MGSNTGLTEFEKQSNHLTEEMQKLKTEKGRYDRISRYAEARFAGHPSPTKHQLVPALILCIGTIQALPIALLMWSTQTSGTAQRAVGFVLATIQVLIALACLMNRDWLRMECRRTAMLRFATVPSLTLLISFEVWEHVPRFGVIGEIIKICLVLTFVILVVVFALVYMNTIAFVQDSKRVGSRGVERNWIGLDTAVKNFALSQQPDAVRARRRNVVTFSFTALATLALNGYTVLSPLVDSAPFILLTTFALMILTLIWTFSIAAYKSVALQLETQRGEIRAISYVCFWSFCLFLISHCIEKAEGKDMKVFAMSVVVVSISTIVPIFAAKRYQSKTSFELGQETVTFSIGGIPVLKIDQNACRLHPLKNRKRSGPRKFWLPVEIIVSDSTPHLVQTRWSRRRIGQDYYYAYRYAVVGDGQDRFILGQIRPWSKCREEIEAFIAGGRVRPADKSTVDIKVLKPDQVAINGEIRRRLPVLTIFGVPPYIPDAVLSEVESDSSCALSRGGG